MNRSKLVQGATLAVLGAAVIGATTFATTEVVRAQAAPSPVTLYPYALTVQAVLDALNHPDVVKTAQVCVNGCPAAYMNLHQCSDNVNICSSDGDQDNEPDRALLQ